MAWLLAGVRIVSFRGCRVVRGPLENKRRAGTSSKSGQDTNDDKEEASPRHVSAPITPRLKMQPPIRLDNRRRIGPMCMADWLDCAASAPSFFFFFWQAVHEGKGKKKNGLQTTLTRCHQQGAHCTSFDPFTSRNWRRGWRMGVERAAAAAAAGKTRLGPSPCLVRTVDLFAGRRPLNNR